MYKSVAKSLLKVYASISWLPKVEIRSGHVAGFVGNATGFLSCMDGSSSTLISIWDQEPNDVPRWIRDGTIWRYVVWPSYDDSTWCKWIIFITYPTKSVQILANLALIWIYVFLCSMKHISGSVNDLANWACTGVWHLGWYIVLMNADRRSVSGGCRYFVIGVQNRSYSRLTTDILLVEHSYYGECTRSMILNDIPTS